MGGNVAQRIEIVLFFYTDFFDDFSARLSDRFIVDVNFSVLVLHTFLKVCKKRPFFNLGAKWRDEVKSRRRKPAKKF